jgi:hypothetical protein
VGLELTTLVVIGTDGIDSYKPNYHTITTTIVSVRSLGNTVHDNIDQKGISTLITHDNSFLWIHDKLTGN